MSDARVPWDELTRRAVEARAQAYAPYSHFAVGAALLATDGTVFVGCNVENVSFGLTQCAERSAITAAVAAGRREFTALAIVARGGVSPCGACRQVLAEFCRTLPILLLDADDPSRARRVELSQLLPEQFAKFDGAP